MGIEIVWGNEPLWEPPKEPRFELLWCFTTAKTTERVLADQGILKLMTIEQIALQINEFIVLDWIATVPKKDKLRCTAEGAAQVEAYRTRLAQAQRTHNKIESARYFEERKAQAHKLGAKLKFGHCNDRYVCPVCRAYAERLYNPDEAPSLPHSDCTSELGECRCFVSVITGS